MLVALVVAQRLRLEVEPFGAKPYQLVFRRFRSGRNAAGTRR